MKKILFLNIASFILPAVALAEQQIPEDDFAFYSAFTGNFSLLLSIVIGAIAIFIIFRAAKKLGGGLFGSVLNYIGIGVSFVVLGTMANVVQSWYSAFNFNVVSMVCFAVGYIFTVIGANKLLKGIMSN